MTTTIRRGCLTVGFAILVGSFAGVAQDRKAPPAKPAEVPVSADPRLVVELFAAAPDIVHPVACDFDAKGRLLVVESHTHFRPANYVGPKFDRIRILEDTNGDGRADKFTTYFEGTSSTMDVAAHPDGSVYVATRNEILRLRDTKGTGTADEKTRIAFLETAGNYPHNGLSGLTFDAKGDLFFGMGENLGADYKLIGADGKTLLGGGEGGNVFWCTADGKNLRRVATGFWNPFGSCRDIFGRMFVVDNDPDSSPPCRLVQVVEHGDYGFQFRYGRSGRHPFQAWNGELPGTLPYAAGTGESPCEVISYESDGLPAEYRGHLLVPAWADHRVEHYVPKANGASIVATRKPFIQGGQEFRPSGLTVAPDGSLFVTDWVSKSYELHGKGAVWHVRWKDAKPPARPADPRRALASADRPTRDAAARTLAKDEEGRVALRKELASASVRVRAAALDALIAINDEKVDLAAIASTEREAGIRAMAVRAIAARGGDTTANVDDTDGSVRFEAIAGLKGDEAVPRLVKLLADSDPFLRHAAVRRLAAEPTLLGRVDRRALTTAQQRIGLLLAWRASGEPAGTRLVTEFLADPDPDVRFLAIKWISDEKLTTFRPILSEMMRSPGLDPRAFFGLATATARLDGKPVSDDALASYFVERLIDKSAPAASRLMALKVVPAGHAKLHTDHLVELLAQPDPAFRIEALRALKDRGDAKATSAVRAIASDTKQPAGVRAQAINTLAAFGPADVPFLIELAGQADANVGPEAIRALTQAKLSPDQASALAALAKDRPDKAALVDRVLGKPFFANRPPAPDIEAWLKLLDGPADPEAGRRVFEHPKLVTCARCHRVDGRGANIGPDLSLIGRTEKRWIAESILQPSTVVAPHFQAWRIETRDGRVRTGLLVHTYLDESHYIDERGDRFKVEARELVDATASKSSIMPEGLFDALTDQEARDLVAYLLTRK